MGTRGTYCDCLGDYGEGRVAWVPEGPIATCGALGGLTGPRLTILSSWHIL